MARPYVQDLEWPKITEPKKGTWLVDTGVRAGKRMRKRFKKLKEAKTWANSFKRPAQLYGKATLTDTQRYQFLQAEDMLKSRGFKSISVVQCVQHYLDFKQVSGKSPNVAEAVKEVIADKSGRYQVQLGVNLKLFLEMFGTRKPADITPDELHACIFKRTDIAETTRQNHYRGIQTFYSYCKEAGWIEESPLKKRHAPDIKPYMPQILTVEETKKLLAHTPDNMRVFMALALFCGVRIQELCRLKFTDIVWNAHDNCYMVLIGPDIGKKNRARNIPIPANADLWLSGYIKPHTPHPVYLKPDRCTYILPGKEGGVSYRIREIGIKAGIKLSQNVMRHSFASYYYEITRDAEQTRYRLGHTTDDILFTHYRQLVARTSTTTSPFEYFKICPPQYGTLKAHMESLGKPMSVLNSPTPEALRALHLL